MKLYLISVKIRGVNVLQNIKNDNDINILIKLKLIGDL